MVHDVRHGHLCAERKHGDEFLSTAVSSEGDSYVLQKQFLLRLFCVRSAEIVVEPLSEGELKDAVTHRDPKEPCRRLCRRNRLESQRRGRQ
jgi:hypothetical protein